LQLPRLPIPSLFPYTTLFRSHASLSQQLRINPRLNQAMDLLYMPLLDLQQHLKQELLGNPFLELVEPEEETEVPLAEEAKEDKRSEEHTSELQSRFDLVCRLL